MNRLEEINIRTVVKKLGLFKSVTLLLLSISILLYCGFRFGNFYHNFQAKKIEQQTERLNSLYKTLAEQTSRINMLGVELTVESLANENSNYFIKNLEQEYFDLKTELAFYEKIMAPENEADGIILDSFYITATESTNRFRFNSVIIQQQKNKRYAKGYVDLVIEGSLDNQPKKLVLSDISSLTKKDLSFSFKFFQRVEGEFTLPIGFKAEKILIRVVLPKGKWQKFNQLNKNYLWTEFLNTEPKYLSPNN